MLMILFFIGMVEIGVVDRCIPVQIVHGVPPQEQRPYSNSYADPRYGSGTATAKDSSCRSSFTAPHSGPQTLRQVMVVIMVVVVVMVMELRVPPTTTLVATAVPSCHFLLCFSLSLFLFLSLSLSPGELHAHRPTCNGTYSISQPLGAPGSAED